MAVLTSGGWAWAALLALSPLASFAAGIYSCTDPNGKRWTSDRPIPECQERDQRLLNRDGSTRAVVTPPMTASERAAKDAADRRALLEQAARNDAMRGDRYLLARYPDEAAHARARESALESVRQSSLLSERRMAVLATERKAIMVEAEFYQGRRLPAKLQQQLDSNEAVTASQRQLMAANDAEGQRIHARFDAEMDRLKRLWAGAAPGSLGPFKLTAAEPALPAARR